MTKAKAKAKAKARPPSPGERVLSFIDQYCMTPEGSDVGRPLKLLPFQRKFILEIYDNKHATRRAILSIARKNGKSAIIAAILLAHVVGPMAKRNSQVVSGAMSRDQASLVFNLALKMLMLNPIFEGHYKAIPSTKRLIGLAKNVEYRALAADGATAHGLSPVLAILDECGQVKGPMTPFIEAILTSQGAHENPLIISEADFLSLQIDDAMRSGDPHTICHLYAADKDSDLMDESQWLKANPALGKFRSKKDLVEQLKQAQRIPAMESTARNLLLNQRISLDSIWLAPTVWKSCSAFPNIDLFRDGRCVSMGLDLSQRNDLTAAVLSVMSDEGVVHLLPYVFTPQTGLEARELRDRAPYTTWVRDSKLIAVPGATIDYDWLFEYLRVRLEDEGIRVDVVAFDRWRINEAKAAAERAGFVVPVWVEVGQGFRDISPRVEFFEQLLLQNKIAHGGHPLLNMAAANCIVVSDPAGNRKVDKSKSTQRIDPLVAALMSAGVHQTEQSFDVSSFVV